MKKRAFFETVKHEPFFFSTICQWTFLHAILSLSIVLRQLQCSISNAFARPMCSVGERDSMEKYGWNSVFVMSQSILHWIVQLCVCFSVERKKCSLHAQRINFACSRIYLHPIMVHMWFKSAAIDCVHIHAQPLAISTLRRSTCSPFFPSCFTAQLRRRTIRSACIVPSTPIHRRVVHFNFLSVFFSGENTWNNYKWIYDELVEIQNSLSPSVSVFVLLVHARTHAHPNRFYLNTKC